MVFLSTAILHYTTEIYQIKKKKPNNHDIETSIDAANEEAKQK